MYVMDSTVKNNRGSADAGRQSGRGVNTERLSRCSRLARRPPADRLDSRNVGCSVEIVLSVRDYPKVILTLDPIGSC
jgi:hypothetical protein